MFLRDNVRTSSRLMREALLKEALTSLLWCRESVCHCRLVERKYLWVLRHLWHETGLGTKNVK